MHARALQECMAADHGTAWHASSALTELVCADEMAWEMACTLPARADTPACARADATAAAVEAAFTAPLRAALAAVDARAVDALAMEMAMVLVVAWPAAASVMELSVIFDQH